ncbi:class I SAM-dependent methyltransferase [Verrucosispora sioxanthis]|uniref:class I SAM-dependent methyltransferase n=1 Tax=Verrucosispora sioxanthis TaxID=2499994 RepID=UPI001C122BAE|nr:class I SAM-dependent methyltransferase [Verrucosispora sioxanthis]
MDRQSDEIVAYYTDRYREDLRLAARPQARLERTRTLELLREYLPAPPARILDVGGGTGEYARALVALGYRVRLLDLVPAHVTQARAGHPTADRCRALAEAVRVTRPGGRVLAAAISRFAGPLDFAATGRLDDRMVEEAAVLLTDGRNDARLGFTHAYFHRVEELLDECRTAGLVDLVVDGIEGPAWIAAEAAAHGPMAETVFTAALRLARVYRREPALVTASAHLLARGTVGDPSDIGRDRPDLRA